MKNLIGWIRQWFAIHREIRGYNKVIRECKKMNREIDKTLGHK